MILVRLELNNRKRLLLQMPPFILITGKKKNKEKTIDFINIISF